MYKKRNIYECAVCKTTYKSSNSLRNHYNNMHSKPQPGHVV